MSLSSLLIQKEIEGLSTEELWLAILLIKKEKDIVVRVDEEGVVCVGFCSYPRTKDMWIERGIKIEHNFFIYLEITNEIKNYDITVKDKLFKAKLSDNRIVFADCLVKLTLMIWLLQNTNKDKNINVLIKNVNEINRKDLVLKQVHP